MGVRNVSTMPTWVYQAWHCEIFLTPAQTSADHWDSRMERSRIWMTKGYLRKIYAALYPVLKQ
jgi:hypothetical protein